MLPIHILVLLVTCCCSSVLPVSVHPASAEAPPPSNRNPGVKLSINERAIDYVLSVVCPYFVAQVQHLKLPDIHEDVHSPIGTISFSITNMAFTTLTVSTPQYYPISSTMMEFWDAGVHVAAQADWSYEEHSFPHLKDHGSIDINIEFSLKIHFGAETDSSKKSGLKILTDGTFDLAFSKFDVKVHGGASWLYNLIISLFKDPIEKEIESVLHSQIPPMVVSETQKALDSLDWMIPTVDGVEFDFRVAEIANNVPNKYIVVGIDGEFEKGSVVFSGSPVTMPDSLSAKPMFSFFLSSWSVDSAGYVFDKVGALTHVLKASDVPASWPFKLETTWWHILLPQLEKQFGDKKMQITFTASPTNPPHLDFSTGVTTLNLEMLSEFQVLNSSTSTVTAFTVDMKLILNVTVEISTRGSGYVLYGKAALQTYSMTVSQSVIGKIDLSTLSTILDFLLGHVIVPLVDVGLAYGIPLPSVPNFALVNPYMVYHDGFFEMRSDFTFKI